MAHFENVFLLVNSMFLHFCALRHVYMTPSVGYFYWLSLLFMRLIEISEKSMIYISIPKIMQQKSTNSGVHRPLKGQGRYGDEGTIAVQEQLDWIERALKCQRLKWQGLEIATQCQIIIFFIFFLWGNLVLTM